MDKKVKKDSKNNSNKARLVIVNLIMKRFHVFIITVLLVVSLTACAGFNSAADQPEVEQAEEIESGIQDGHIYFYGEGAHGDKDYYTEELRIWGEFYDKGCRHLFEEVPYYEAEYLNEWMKADSDTILYELFRDWEGTAVYTSSTLEFYHYIKEHYPETIFHGTDVGHQWESTGKRYLKKLEDEGRTDTEEYAIAKENYEQGKAFYSSAPAGVPVNDYREKCMAENVTREYEKIKGETVMGIYGTAHIWLGKKPYCNIDTMSQMLSDHYGDTFHTDLIVLPENIRTDTLTVAGKEYEATFFGEIAIDSETKYAYGRLENAFEDLKDCPLTENVLPYYNFPMKIEEQQIYILEEIKKDGSVERYFYRSDGYTWEGYPTTIEIKIEE